jgi:hypothetical protein
MRMGGYRTLLHLNNQNTIGGNYVPEQQDRQQYHNSTLAAIMSVYWPTITCLYLIWSFLSFDLDCLADCCDCRISDQKYQ